MRRSLWARAKGLYNAQGVATPYVVGRVIVGGSTFATIAVASRLLSRSSFGIFVVVMTGLQIAVSLTATGISAYTLRHPAIEDDHERTRRTLAASSAALASCAGVFVALSISQLPTTRAVVALAILGGYAQGYVEAVVISLLASGEARRYVTASAVAGGGRVMAAIGLAILGASPSEVALLPPVIAAVMLIPVAGAKASIPSLSGESVSRILRYASAASTIAIPSFVLAVGDRILVARYAGPVAAGVYAANYIAVDQPIQLLLSPVLQRELANTAVLPRAEAHTRFVGVLRAISMRAPRVGVLALLLSPVTVAVVMGVRVVPGVLAWVVLSSAAFKVVEWLLSEFHLRRAPARISAVIAVAAVANVSLNILAIPRLGILGAALATFCSTALLVVVAAHATPTPISTVGWPSVIAAFGALAAAAACLYLVNAVVRPIL